MREVNSLIHQTTDSSITVSRNPIPVVIDSVDKLHSGLREIISSTDSGWWTSIDRDSHV